MNGHSDMVGMIESGEISHEDFEPPSFDEEKERRAGFFDDDQDKVVPNGNVQVTFEDRLQQHQRILDEMINLNGKAGKSKYGFLNSQGRRNLQRLSIFLNDIGEH